VLRAEAQFAKANAEPEAPRRPEETAIDESIALMPIASLKLARTRFNYLAEGLATNGVLVSQDHLQDRRARDRQGVGRQPAPGGQRLICRQTLTARPA